jgi:peptidoglycan/LPS O-acetylase OafA/YrhL
MSINAKAIDSLTGLRWWAAFAVFLFHMTVFAPIPIFEWFEFGYYGVMFFFVLSGFVLSWSWKPETPVRVFYLRRIGRIWPSAFVALLLAIPVFYSFNPDPSHWWVKPFDAGILLLSLILIQGWWLAPVILFSGNPAAWTLTCEFFFYALHPIFQKVLVRLSRASVALVLVGVFVSFVSIKVSCLISAGQGCLDLPLPLARLHEFVLGMGIGVLAKKGWLPKLSVWIPITLMAVLFACVTFLNTFLGSEASTSFATSLSIEVTLLLILLTVGCVADRELSGRRTGFEGKWTVRLGELSFNFYLVHATVMYVLISIFGELDVRWSNLLWYPIVLVIGLAIAQILNVWVEKPFEAKIRGLADRIGSKVNE